MQRCMVGCTRRLIGSAGRGSALDGLAKVDEAAASKAATERYKGEVEEIKRLLLSNGLAPPTRWTSRSRTPTASSTSCRCRYGQRSCRSTSNTGRSGARRGRGRLNAVLGPAAGLTLRPDRLPRAVALDRRRHGDHQGAVDRDGTARERADPAGRAGQGEWRHENNQHPRCRLWSSAPLCRSPRSASAQPQSTDWPCVQRLVPKLEAGQMWSGPPLEEVASSLRRSCSRPRAG